MKKMGMDHSEEKNRGSLVEEDDEVRGHVFWFMGMVNLKAINSKKRQKVENEEF